MSRIGAVIKKIYAKDLETVSNVSNALSIETAKNWVSVKWQTKIKSLTDSRTIIVAITSTLFLSVLFSTAVFYFNRFNECSVVVSVCKADLEKEFRRRDNLLPNITRLVETYSVYEEKMFKYISAAREELSSAQALDPLKGAAGKELEKPLTGLLGLAEQYPNLKAMQSIQDFISAIIITENRIADGKEKFNKAAEYFNQLLTTFPGNMYSKFFRLKLVEYIGIDKLPDKNGVSKLIIKQW